MQGTDRPRPAGKINLIVNRGGDGNRILIWSSAADDPGTYYVYDRAGAAHRGLRQPLSTSSIDHRFAPVRADPLSEPRRHRHSGLSDAAAGPARSGACR